MALANNNPEVEACISTLANSSLMTSLLAVCESMAHAVDLSEVLNTILVHSLAEMNAQEGSILLFNEELDRLEMLAQIGLPDFIIAKGYIQRKGSIAEWVIEHNQPLIMNDNPSNMSYQALDQRRRIFSSMCIPLRLRGKVLGTINLNRTDACMGFFTDKSLDVMVLLSNQAAVFIENSRLHEATLKAERLAAIGQTVAGISHCIKNVLTGVKGGMSLIEMATRSENRELQVQGQDVLKRNLERLYSIVLDMLDYSKERVPMKNTVPVHTIADEVIATVASEAKMRDVTLEMRVTGDIGAIACDGQQIYRCVLNLVHNAVEATPRGGTVWIDAERTTAPAAVRRLKASAESAVIIRVGDTGDGVSEEHRRTIFEPFFSTKGSKGTGLGLAVTRKIIEEHGGHIRVETVSPEPAIFAIHLPG